MTDIITKSCTIKQESSLITGHIIEEDKFIKGRMHFIG